MDFELEGKVAFVTGSSAGIGRETAILFAKLGAKVAVTFHSDKDGAASTVEAVESHGSHGMAVHYDLEDPASIEAAVEAVVAKWGQIDVFVANAVRWLPSTHMVPFADAPVEAWLPVVRSNTEGVYRTLQLVVKQMRGKGWGRIVLVSSTLAEEGLPRTGPYATAKSALHGLSQVLARELGPEGVLVNVVKPGLTTTDRTVGGRVPKEIISAMTQATPTGRLATAEEVARVIVFLASGANGNATGQSISVNGGK